MTHSRYRRPQSSVSLLQEAPVTSSFAEFAGRLWLSSFIFIFIYIVLNICILIVEDAYFMVRAIAVAYSTVTVTMFRMTLRYHCSVL